MRMLVVWPPKNERAASQRVFREIGFTKKLKISYEKPLNYELAQVKAEGLGV